MHVAVLGSIRNLAEAAYIFSDVLRLREEGVAESVVFSTWAEQIDRHAAFCRELERRGVQLVACPPLGGRGHYDPTYPGNLPYQKWQMQNALRQMPPAGNVFKTRTDHVISLHHRVSNVFRQSSCEFLDDTVLVSSANLLRPADMVDLFFAASLPLMRNLARIEIDLVLASPQIHNAEELWFWDIFKDDESIRLLATEVDHLALALLLRTRSMATLPSALRRAIAAYWDRIASRVRLTNPPLQGAETVTLTELLSGDGRHGTILSRGGMPNVSQQSILDRLPELIAPFRPEGNGPPTQEELDELMAWNDALPEGSKILVRALAPATRRRRLPEPGLEDLLEATLPAKARQGGGMSLFMSLVARNIEGGQAAWQTFLALRDATPDAAEFWLMLAFHYRNYHAEVHARQAGRDFVAVADRDRRGEALRFAAAFGTFQAA